MMASTSPKFERNLFLILRHYLHLESIQRYQQIRVIEITELDLEISDMIFNLLPFTDTLPILGSIVQNG